MSMLNILGILLLVSCVLSLARSNASPTNLKSRLLLNNEPVACQEQAHRGKGAGKDILLCALEPSSAPISTPTVAPRVSPTVTPTGPTLPPSRQPSSQPSGQPSASPTKQPSSQPSKLPTAQPISAPTAQPSAQPNSSPSVQPSGQPTHLPSGQPTSSPSGQPSCRPSQQPVVHPSAQPSSQPTSQPSSPPSEQPSTQPSEQPSGPPTNQPSGQPSYQPSAQPSKQPSGQPNAEPTGQPTDQPSGNPSGQPSAQPSRLPSVLPSASPTSQPFAQPTLQPSGQPNSQPTTQPVGHPSSFPSAQPSGQPTHLPSGQPTSSPSGQPSCRPSQQPVGQPSSHPSSQPISQPSSTPSGLPSTQPSEQSSGRPTNQPSGQPSLQPSEQPSAQPNPQPTLQPFGQPSAQPSGQPSSQPSEQPSNQPTEVPSCQPSGEPSGQPSAQPSAQPYEQPSSQPTCQPSQPSSQPSDQPTGRPSAHPSSQPTEQPTEQPSSQPTGQPTGQLSRQPTAQPTTQPSAQPSAEPNTEPSTQPRTQPSAHPSIQPSGQPTSNPLPEPAVDVTGSWITSITNVTHVWYTDGHVWACTATKRSSCSVLNAATGAIVSKYLFEWDETASISVIDAPSLRGLYMGGRTSNNGVASSVAAVCYSVLPVLTCSTKAFTGLVFTAATYSPYTNKFLYVGSTGSGAAGTVIEATPSAIDTSYVYTTTLMKSLVLLYCISPPDFVGGVVTGVATSSTANSILAGWINLNTGVLSAHYVVPASGIIRNSAELVNGMALEPLGPDSFVVGGMTLSSDGVGMCGYLVRTNTLYRAIKYAVRYRAQTWNRQRRSLTEQRGAVSVSRDVVYAGGLLYIVADCEHSPGNISVVVMQVSAEDGSILKQVLISSSRASITCANIITSASSTIALACSVAYHGAASQSVIISAHGDLSFAQLPPGFAVISNNTLFMETVVLKAVHLPIKMQRTSVTPAESTFVAGDSAPTHRPSPSPSGVLSRSPVRTPSSQPSSSPTASPSRSARPTSQPSTTPPTNTRKPVAPTAVPAVAPTMNPTLHPTITPTIIPTTKPTQVPSTAQTATPSRQPTVVQSRVPVVLPTSPPKVQRTLRPTRSAPTLQPSVVTVVVVESGVNATRKVDVSVIYYVVGVVGGVIFLLFCAGPMWTRYQHVKRNASKHQRRRAYYKAYAKLYPRRWYLPSLGLNTIKEESNPTHTTIHSVKVSHEQCDSFVPNGNNVYAAESTDKFNNVQVIQRSPRRHAAYSDYGTSSGNSNIYSVISSSGKGIVDYIGSESSDGTCSGSGVGDSSVVSYSDSDDCLYYQIMEEGSECSD